MGNENKRIRKEAQTSFSNLNNVLNGSKAEQADTKREERLAAINKRSNKWEKRLQKNREKKTSLPDSSVSLKIDRPANNVQTKSLNDIVACKEILSKSLEVCELSELNLSLAKIKSMNFSAEQMTHLNPELMQVENLIKLLETSEIEPIYSKFCEELKTLKGALSRSESGKEAFVIVCKLLSNLAQNPEIEKFNKINLQNTVIKSKLIEDHETEVVSFFGSIGFVKKENFLQLESNDLFTKGKELINQTINRLVRD